ncbi:hypothetical protein ACHAXN_012890 [Cyclotella atomus]
MTPSEKPIFPLCNHCGTPSSSSIKIKACTVCYTCGYCSRDCQRKAWTTHKTSCRRQATASTSTSSASSSPNTCNSVNTTVHASNDDVVRLEVQSGSGEWCDAGPINMINDVGSLNLSANSNTSNSSSETKQPQRRTKDLSTSAQKYLQNTKYKYRHSSDGIDTNLLILLHGAGDTHEPYDKLAIQMALPQTATLAISARNVALPLNLGYAWFEEMDGIGNPLASSDERRLGSLSRAVGWLEHLLCLLTGLKDDKNAATDDRMIWVPERVFLLGFSAGACLAMELCRSWRYNGRLALGGVICVAGGIKTQSLARSTNTNESLKATSNEATDVLVIAGSNDETFSPQLASKSRELYVPSSKVQVHVERGKGHSMIGSRSEMTVVMEFLSKRMVKQMTSMENMTSIH